MYPGWAPHKKRHAQEDLRHTTLSGPFFAACKPVNGPLAKMQESEQPAIGHACVYSHIHGTLIYMCIYIYDMDCHHYSHLPQRKSSATAAASESCRQHYRCHGSPLPKLLVVIQTPLDPCEPLEA